MRVGIQRVATLVGTNEALVGARVYVFDAADGDDYYFADADGRYTVNLDLAPQEVPVYDAESEGGVIQLVTEPDGTTQQGYIEEGQYTFVAEAEVAGVTHWYVTAGVPMFLGSQVSRQVIVLPALPSGAWTEVPGITLQDIDTLRVLDAVGADLTETFEYRHPASNQLEIRSLVAHSNIQIKLTGA